jgi:hypothetical protein
MRFVKHFVVAACTAAFVAAAVAPMAIGQEKKLTPQQERMKDCSTKWNAEKAKTGVKGRAAHNKFMSSCLKKKGTA